MKRRIVSLLLAVIMLFGLLPVTALAHDHWSSNDAVFIGAGGFESQTYTIFGGETGVTAGYSVWDGNYLTHRIELHDSDGSYIDYAKCTDTIGGAWIFFRGNYWYDAYDWKNMGAPSEKSGHDDVLTLGTLQIASKEKDRVLYVRRYPLTIFDSNSNAYATVSQRSQFSRNSTQDRTVILYLDGTEVARKTVLFPHRHNADAGDLNVTAKSGYVHASTKVDGTTYHVYLTTGPRKVTIRYKLIGDHKTKGAVDTNGLKNSAIADVVFQDKSWNQSNNFIKEYNQLPLSTVEIDTARSTNQLLLYEAADVKLVSGDAGIENSGTDKYKITVGYENSVIEVAYKARFPHADPLYIDWYKRGAGGIFDLLKENANQPYGFDLTNLHEQETFYVIQNGGLTQEAKDAGLGQEYVDSKGQHYRFWKAAVGFDWDWIDSLYYKSSAQTWFYTYKINLYYRDIFAHEWKVWKTITVGPIEVPYDEGRINFVYQRYNPDTGEDNPEDTGDYSFTLAYDGNAGAERIGVPAPDTRTDVAMDNDKYTFYVSVYQPTRDGYTFLGWDENPNATTPTYPAGNLGPVIFNGSDGKTQTKTLYAIWEKTGGDSATYTATFYRNDGTQAVHDTQSGLSSGAPLTQPADPKRDGYTFGGWYTTDTCTDGTKWDFATNTVQTQDIYLYAKWTEAASTSYTINYYKDYQDGDQPFETTSGNGYVGDVINADVDNNKPDATYIVDTSRTTKTSMKLVEKLTDNDNVLNIYYEKDEKGGGEDGNDPDNIPDKYQKKITFIVVNGTWSDNTTTKDVYVTLLDAAGKWSEDGTGTLTAPTDMKAATGYNGGSWDTEAPTTVNKNTTPDTYTYTFSKNTYTVSIINGAGGSSNPTGNKTVNHGDDLTITITPNDGYCIEKITLDDVEQEIPSDKKLELKDIKENHTVNITYAIDSNGDDVPDKYQKKVTFQIVNGTWADGTATDKTVYVTLCKDNKWDVNGEGTLTAPTDMMANTTYDQASGKWDTPTPASSVTGTDPVTYTYRFSKLKVDYTIKYFVEGEEKTGWQITGSGEIGETINADTALNKPVGYIYDSATSIITKELGPKAEENVLEVYYEKDENHDSIPDKYQVKVTFKVVNGTWSDGTATDKTVYVTLYKDSKWDANGEGTLTAPTDMKAATGYNGGSWAPTLPEKVTKDSADTYTYSFSNDTRKVTVTNVGSGHTDKDGENTVNYGDSLTITISPDANYCIEKITLDNVEQTIPTDKKFVVSNVTTDKTVEITYAADDNHDNIPDKYQKQITYKVVNGFWDTAKTDKADKVEYVTLLDENGKWSEDGTGTLTAPTDMKAATGYNGGSWDAVVPTTVNKDTKPDTYTYTFIKDDGLWATVTYEILNGHGSIDAGQTASFTVLKGTKWGEAGITAPTTTAESGYRFAGWVGELAAEETIETSFTITGSFVINEGEWVTIRFIAGKLYPRKWTRK